jgi:hypothetical protein
MLIALAKLKLSSCEEFIIVPYSAAVEGYLARPCHELAESIITYAYLVS